jgi:arylsulfatase A-like enzyme
MGWSDIGCYGSEVATPNLDRLASEGIRFTQMHNTSKCFPSRATLQTGIYAQQSGYDKSYKQPLANCVTLGTVLQTAGYRTFWSGKHHGVETPVDIGYDRYYGLREGASNHFNPGPSVKVKPSLHKSEQTDHFSLTTKNISHMHPPQIFIPPIILQNTLLDGWMNIKMRTSPFSSTWLTPPLTIR